MFCFIISILYVCFKDNYFWYDESGQFWMAKGLNHYSPPYSETSDLRSVIENNRFYNLDPGGFTILLHFWSMISNEALFLKLLPFLFFIGTCVLSYLIINRITKDILLSIIAATLPIIYPLLFWNALFLRAYSMEMCGTMFCIYVLQNFTKINTYIRIILISIIISLFCTSRYGFIIVSFIVSLRILYKLYLHNTKRKWIIKSILFGLPLLITTSIIYILMAKYQNNNNTIYGYSDTLYESYILYFDRNSILFYIMCSLYLYKKLKGIYIEELHLDAILITSIFFCLSSLNLYPWTYQRMISVTMLLIYALFVELCKYVLYKKYMKSILMLAIVTFTAYEYHNNVYFKHLESSIDAKELEQYIKTKNPSRIFIHAGYVPDIRYLYEYGYLKHAAIQDNYPKSFYLQKGFRHQKIFKKERIQISPLYGFDKDNFDVYMARSGVRSINELTKYPNKYQLVPECRSLYIKKVK